MKAYIGLGSNLGDRLENLRFAVAKIGLIEGVRILRISSIYETEPVECEGDWFYNAVLEIDSGLDSSSLMAELRRIETSLGKTGVEKNCPRVIDLDLLIFGFEILRRTDLIVPHSRMHRRRFVLEPLCELDENLIHPVFKKTMRNLLKDLEDDAVVKKAIPILPVGAAHEVGV